MDARTPRRRPAVVLGLSAICGLTTPQLVAANDFKLDSLPPIVRLFEPAAADAVHPPVTAATSPSPQLEAGWVTDAISAPAKLLRRVPRIDTEVVPVHAATTYPFHSLPPELNQPESPRQNPTLPNDSDPRTQLPVVTLRRIAIETDEQPGRNEESDREIARRSPPTAIDAAPGVTEQDRILLLSQRNLKANTKRSAQATPGLVLDGDPNGHPSAIAQESIPPRITAAVERHAVQLLRQSIALADRGAYYSARAQLIATMRLVVQALDAETATNQYSTALACGLRALEEAADFAPAGAQLEADLDVSQIVATHSTPVLREDPDRHGSTLAALQEYHAFAEEQLALACGQEQVASEALMVLAKIQPRLVAHDRESATTAGPRAMSLYQAALMVNPDNYLAANELAVLFASFGQLEDARDVLAHCVRVAPDQPTMWRNLAEIHHRLGEHDLSRAALEECRLASQPGPVASGSPARPTVEWVEPSVFSNGSERAAQASPRSQVTGKATSESEFVHEPSQQQGLPPKPSSQAQPEYVSRQFANGPRQAETNR